MFFATNVSLFRYEEGRNPPFVAQDTLRAWQVFKLLVFIWYSTNERNKLHKVTKQPPLSILKAMTLKEKNHPWLELSDVHKETTENIRVTVIPFYMGYRFWWTLAFLYSSEKTGFFSGRTSRTTSTGGDTASGWRISGRLLYSSGRGIGGYSLCQVKNSLSFNLDPQARARKWQ